MPGKTEPEKGDKVSWNWGGGAPGGTVAEKKTEGEIAIKSKRGNTIKKNAEPSNPAVHIEREGNDVVKRASELNIEKKASGNQGGKSAGDKRKAKDEEPEKGEEDDDPHTRNSQGKEVKKGGKEANKKQKQTKDDDVKSKKTTKASQDGDEDESNSDDDDAKNFAKPNGTTREEKKVPSKGKSSEKKAKANSKAKGDPTPRKSGDLVSSRTRSQGKK